MMNRIRGLKQQVNGHACFHLQGIRQPVRKGNKQKNQNENMCLRRESNQRPLAVQLDFTYSRSIALKLDRSDTNKLKIRILSQTSILYLIRHASVILILGLHL